MYAKGLLVKYKAWSMDLDTNTGPAGCVSLAKLASLFLQVASDIATVKQALLSCKLISVSLQTPSTSSSEGLIPALLAGLHTQHLPSPAKNSMQQQPDQDQALGSTTTPESHQGQASLVQARSAAHPSDVELHSAVKLQQCACGLLYALASLSTVLSQHGAIEDACAAGLYMAVIEALSDQVRLT